MRKRGERREINLFLQYLFLNFPKLINDNRSYKNKYLKSLFI
uniref:Uncharacterized protein n=1 Tax=Meloidogyne enterolobii TaxID=390850 RepID=A0A6V7XKQ1_MELEN|nr:unnamed protein product [Meloidogyne enterolobii]